MLEKQELLLGYLDVVVNTTGSIPGRLGLTGSRDQQNLLVLYKSLKKGSEPLAKNGLSS